MCIYILYIRIHGNTEAQGAPRSPQPAAPGDGHTGLRVRVRLEPLGCARGSRPPVLRAEGSFPREFRHTGFGYDTYTDRGVGPRPAAEAHGPVRNVNIGTAGRRLYILSCQENDLFKTCHPVKSHRKNTPCNRHEETVNTAAVTPMALSTDVWMKTRRVQTQSRTPTQPGTSEPDRTQLRLRG